MTRRRLGRVAAAAATALLAGGCVEMLRVPLSTLDPAGPAAASVAGVWWAMFWASLVITALMVGLALYAAKRNARSNAAVPSRLLILGGGIAFPLGSVTALLIYGLPAGQGLLAAPDDPRAFHVEVNAHQWWWQVRYPDVGGAALHDANELHVPAGRPVHVHITTSDVIHSFWVPRLSGKLDAIPGHTNVLRIEAERPGVYRGQCAEFCGQQHARMAFLLEAHDEGALQARLERLSRRTATEPPPAFSTHCAQCHSVDARSDAVASPQLLGPNLAALSERRYLGAGWIPNTDGALARWIREHQAIKPGNRMPDMGHLDDAEIDEIVSFLEQRP